MVAFKIGTLHFNLMTKQDTNLGKTNFEFVVLASKKMAKARLIHTVTLRERERKKERRTTNTSKVYKSPKEVSLSLSAPLIRPFYVAPELRVHNVYTTT